MSDPRLVMLVAQTGDAKTINETTAKRPANGHKRILVGTVLHTHEESGESLDDGCHRIGPTTTDK